MNIIINKNIFLAPITKLVGITEKRSLMPILSNLLIEFSPTGIRFYSTDLEISAIGYIDHKTDFEKKIIIHGKKLQEILREMENDDISLEITDNILLIKQKHSEFVLSLQDPEEFPEVREISGHEEIFINGKALLEMINKVDFAVSLDETRYVLTGMYMKGLEGDIVVVGTDGFRMSLYRKDIAGLKGFKGIIIPRRSIAEIERIIDEDEEVKICISEKHIQFSTKNVTLISRIIEGSFPDFDNVIPESNVNVVKIDKEAIFKGLKKVSAIIGRSEPVKITLYDNTMDIEAESEIGRAKEVIEVDYSGEKINMNFNVRFVIDVVSHIDGTNIIIKAPSAYGAVLFEGEEGKNYKNIIMPIRI
jgi:DNA polymerase-3 subunit beta